MAVMRAFIALELSEEVAQRLDRISNELKLRFPHNAVRWVPAQNIHLTLKFLGDVSIANLEALQKMIQAECEDIPPFDLSVGSVGAFPSLNRPRVIWVGVTAPAVLSNLYRNIELAAARLGYPPEERPFSPHLTLGRAARNASPAELQQIGQALRGYNIGFLGAVHIPAVHLYKSDLSPAGARYTKLFTAWLKKPMEA
jgi:2'-5' RNA ligase